jgi:transcriptional regulator with XRE-family HTH domain
VGRNVRQLRERRGLSIRDLAAALAELLDKPFHPSGVVKIEKAERGVDADELVALALALGVTTNRVLLTDDAARDDEVKLTPNVSVSHASAWWWATGEKPLPGESAVSDEVFGMENRPHDPPDTATLGRLRALEGQLGTLRRGVAEAREAGLSAATLGNLLAVWELDDVDRQLRGDGLKIGTEEEGSRGER